ncbi:hypothetical protein [[Acholeplasma] multilocale]|uniref:hypothetical protein n=1 Tax=[Acholeplasma] multilocale TaxID=264638 RepID=UPI00047CC4D5|nr:hypothetical protein [[Acholeplasma] multilocale]
MENFNKLIDFLAERSLEKNMKLSSIDDIEEFINFNIDTLEKMIELENDFKNGSHDNEDLENLIEGYKLIFKNAINWLEFAKDIKFSNRIKYHFNEEFYLEHFKIWVYANYNINIVGDNKLLSDVLKIFLRQNRITQSQFEEFYIFVKKEHEIADNDMFLESLTNGIDEDIFNIFNNEKKNQIVFDDYLAIILKLAKVKWYCDYRADFNSDKVLDDLLLIYHVFKLEEIEESGNEFDSNSPKLIIKKMIDEIIVNRKNQFNIALALLKL